MENLKSFFKDKKEAAEVEVKNFKARKDLMKIVDGRGNELDLLITVHREGQSVLLNERLIPSGYDPEDHLLDDIKNKLNEEAGPAVANVSVVKGEELLGNFFFRKRN